MKCHTRPAALEQGYVLALGTQLEGYAQKKKVFKIDLTRFFLLCLKIDTLILVKVTLFKVCQILKQTYMLDKSQEVV